MKESMEAISIKEDDSDEIGQKPQITNYSYNIVEKSLNDHINDMVGIGEQDEQVNPKEYLNLVIDKLKKTIFFMLSDNELLWD